MTRLSSATAAILAGGLGTRLRPVVPDKPKVLAEVGERPFLAYVLDQLVTFDIRHVVLCTGYLGEQVRGVFGNAYGPLHLVYSQELSPLGTAGALRLALPLFRTNCVLVMNGDSICQADLRAFWIWHWAQCSEATLLLAKSSETRRYGRVRVNENGLIISFDEKNDHGEPGWINAGVYLLNRRWLIDIPAGRAVSLEEEVFPSWVRRGIYGFQSNGRLIDIGTPESYATAEKFLGEWKRV